MKLYLASYAKVTINKIIKNEKNVFTGKKAVFIPTAGNPYKDKSFVEEDKKALEQQGMEVIDIDIKNALNEATIVLVAGGDTFYLMDNMLKSNTGELIKNFIKNGGVYIGSSAGSIICCSTIEGAEEFDDPSLAPNLPNYNGLGVFPDVIIPHAHKEKYFERIKRATSKLNKEGFSVYPLTDGEVLFYDGTNIEIL
ncbi:Type 1 glutamine amidotransferase-like domain-containing protein [Candidatus Saccharibacteria bacterium]|nr:Type 1 glutamine amidotransferase-like domain-containing protein [Candidatus Saccharibacteria bacterium]